MSQICPLELILWLLLKWTLITLLTELDRDLFLLLNGLHTEWLDPVMFWLTKTWVWLPLYAFLLFQVIKNYGKQSWVPLLGIAIVLVLADRITSGVMKPHFERLRPSHEPALQGLVHLVNNYRGGKYGFVSSHAANTFGTAVFFFLLFRKKYTWVSWLFVWAAVMTYTRIYLGVHYPGDIIAGGALGALFGWTGYTGQRLLATKIP
jgi:undecaprenyl-diphosphatase